MMKKGKSLLFLFIMFSLVFQINAVKTRTDFGVKKVEPDKVQLKKGGKEIQIKITGKNLIKVEDVVIGKFRGKKFIKSSIKTKILKKRSSSRQLFIRISAGTKVNLGEKYILRLLGKKVNKDTPFLDVPSKILKISVVPLIERKAVPLRAPLPSRKTLSSTRPPIRPLYTRSYSLNKRNLEIKNDGRLGIIVVNGRDLEKVTSAQVILNNIVVKNIKVELGVKKGNTREIKFTALPGVKTVANYNLRLLYGNRKVDLPSSKFTMRVNSVPKVGTTSLQKTTTKTTQYERIAKTTTIPIIKKSSNKIALQKSTLKELIPLESIKEIAVKPSINRFIKNPDLVVTDFNSESEFLFSDAARFNFKIKNIGDKEAVFPVNSKLVSIRLEEDAWPFAETISSALTLAPGETKYFNKSWGLSNVPPGDHNIIVVVDPMDQVTEKSENNNTYSHPYTLVTVGADLEITDIQLDPVSPNNREPFEIKVTIKNNSNYTVNTQGVIPIVSSQNIGVLNKTLVINPNSSVQKIITPLPGAYIAGTYDWTFMVDPQNEIEETNENNNSYSKNVTITEAEVPTGSPPDLVIREFNMMTPSITPSDSLRFNFKVKNIGTGPAVLPVGFCVFSIEYYEGNWPSKEFFSGPVTLMPGESRYFNKSMAFGDISLGEQQITIKLDPDNVLSESIENNNQMVITYTVNTP